MANIINKGIWAVINASGEQLIEGEAYTCTLYYSPKVRSARASVDAIATTIDGVTTCSFKFSPTETEKLRAGSVILEIFDAGLNQLSYIEDFATVRSNSLSV